MKKNLHMKLEPVKVRMSNGTDRTFYLSKRVDNLSLDVDWHNHPAWTKEKKGGNEAFAEVGRFKNKFKGLTDL